MLHSHAGALLPLPSLHVSRVSPERHPVPLSLRVGGNPCRLDVLVSLLTLGAPQSCPTEGSPGKEQPGAFCARHTLAYPNALLPFAVLSLLRFRGPSHPWDTWPLYQHVLPDRTTEALSCQAFCLLLITAQPSPGTLCAGLLCSLNFSSTRMKRGESVRGCMGQPACACLLVPSHWVTHALVLWSVSVWQCPCLSVPLRSRTARVGLLGQPGS